MVGCVSRAEGCEDSATKFLYDIDPPVGSGMDLLWLRPELPVSQ